MIKSTSSDKLNGKLFLYKTLKNVVSTQTFPSLKNIGNTDPLYIEGNTENTKKIQSMRR